MIFGYISRTEHPIVERYIEELDPKGIIFRYRCDDKYAYFFRDSMNCDLSPFYEDSRNLILIEGIPIRGIYTRGYEHIDAIDSKDIEKDFYDFITEIVTNVSIINFKKDVSKLYLSSNRAASGRIYYRYIDGGIAFSSSFSILFRLKPSIISSEAIYSILKYGCAPPPLTLSRDIYMIPPAHYAVIDLLNFEFSLYPYFRFCFSEEHNSDLNELNKILDATSEILNQLKCSLLLSGGVDSTLLAHKMHERSGRSIKAYFLALSESDPELFFAKEAAKSSGSQLKVIYINENEISEVIEEIASSYDIPFNDFSVIPTYYLMKHVANDENIRIVVDGTGGDGCFGFGTIFLDRIWTFTYSLPMVVKKMIRFIYSYSPFWRKESILENAFRTIAKCCEFDINLGPLILCPSNDVFPAHADYDKDIGNLLIDLVDKLILPVSSQQVFKQRATVADIIYGCGSLMAAKTYLRNKFPRLYTLYPFLWRDVLEEQGKISWSAKINNNKIVKWPLKRILERYMPSQFVYRRKSGLTPDLEGYIKNPKVYSLIKETVCRPASFISNFTNKDKFSRLFKDLQSIEGYSLPLRHLIWGITFVETWMQKH